MPARRTPRRLGMVGVLAGLALLLVACDDPPTTVATTVNYACQIKSNNGLVPDSTSTSVFTYDTIAPQAVAPGGDLTIKIVPRPFSVDGNPTSSGTVAQLSAMVWKVAVPAGTTLASHTIDGWANVGSGTPTSSVSGSTVTVTVPGPMATSTTANPNSITLPALTMNLKATGALGSRINATILGTSYGSPGLTFNARVTGTAIGTLNPSFNCYPNPSPTLHSTLVSNDTKAPVITIDAPVADATVVRNAVVKAAFSCDDGTGVGVASCVGTVAKGTAIDTATLGAKTFTVTATDNEGKVGTKTVSYTVVAA